MGGVGAKAAADARSDQPLDSFVLFTRNLSCQPLCKQQINDNEQNYFSILVKQIFSCSSLS